MAKYVYPAIFHPEEEGGFSIFFPDISGCFSQGNDIIDGITMASDALSLMLYSMEEDDDEIPMPSLLKDVKAEGNDFATYVFADTSEYHKKFFHKQAAGSKKIYRARKRRGKSPAKERRKFLFH